MYLVAIVSVEPVWPENHALHSPLVLGNNNISTALICAHCPKFSFSTYYENVYYNSEINVTIQLSYTAYTAANHYSFAPQIAMGQCPNDRIPSSD